ncbi:MAG: DUF1553 domain-containing protein [Bacteroidota bacterium]
MSTQKHIRLFGLALLLFGALFFMLSADSPNDQLSFNRDVRPILNQHCLSCHGGVRQNGGFSLLFEADAYLPTESALPAIVPGDAEASELFKRLNHPDPEMRMPYDAPALDKTEIEILRRWIDQGAKWETHWAYQVPQKTTPPFDTLAPIDAFVKAKLLAQGLSFNPPAPKAQLLRRVSLDLTGLPPSPQIAQRYLQDNSEQAYEQLIDSLLASPSFGEHWASMWLDLARYADSKGYEKDLNRQIWPYRDWVIRAFNADMPFDQFSIEQLAGDLLPSPSEEQLLATGFLRNSMANDEGGTDDEEFRVAAQIERVGTSWEVWMGTTMACVQCHSHPYDPIRMEDFYGFMAYLDNTADTDLYNEQPKQFQYPDSSLSGVQQKIDWVLSQTEQQINLPDTFFHPQTQSLLWQLGYRRIEGEEYQAHSELIELNAPRQESVSQIQDSSWVMYRDIMLDGIDQIDVHYTTPHSGAYLDIYQDELYGPLLGTLRLGNTNGWKESATKSLRFAPLRGTHDLYFHFRMAQDFSNELMRLDWWQLVPAQSTYTQASPALKDSIEALALVPAQASLILQELAGEARRETQLFNRGNWLDPLEVVAPKLADIFAASPNDRLSLARWTVAPENPLTARVMVNRFWQQLFGQGIVATPEDFGTQGAQPSHPALLDYLAVEFQTTYGWSIKRLLKELVLSQTYRQSSRSDSLREAIDPFNQLLSRSKRVRLTAEQIRDQSLSVAALLDERMYGPPVRVEAPVSNDPYRQGNLIDFDPYRRSVYTFWKRTYPVPFQITFDSPQRNICSSRRINTNTPLQALSMLNDSIMFRAAQHLAAQFASETDPKMAIIKAYQKLFYRSPQEAKLQALHQLYHQAEQTYQQDQSLLLRLADEGFERNSRHAAMSLTMNALLNLDEWISKP